MSSATSTDAPGLRPWHFFVIAALVTATAAVLMSDHTLPAQLVLLSLTVFAAGAAAVACYRMVVPLVGPNRAARTRISHTTKSALEREKQLVLRSIKELEFDRAMGKVGDEDFADLTNRLKTRAVRIMTQLDHGSMDHRRRIEQELDAALLGKAPVDAAARVCPACQTENDPDARFCKQCGGRL